MERLTKHTPVEFGYAEYVWNGDVDEQDAIDRLGAYEDTGLTPEEINHYRWVSVAECPPADGSYLACVNGVCGIYITVLDFCKRGEDVDDFTLRGRKNIFYACDSEYGYYTVSGVTHWMPLPKPPKGE